MRKHERMDASADAITTRWRAFQSQCFSIQGALCNASLMVGGSLTQPHDDKCKRLAFNVYRWLQVRKAASSVELVQFSEKQEQTDAC